MTTTTTENFANVPHPAGAVYVDDWDPTATDGNPGRYYRGAKWEIDRDGHNTVIEIDGTQYADGSMSRNVNVVEDRYERLMDLSADRVREIGQALIAAADRVERMASADAMRVLGDGGERRRHTAFQELDAILDVFPSSNWSPDDVQAVLDAVSRQFHLRKSSSPEGIVD